MLFSRFTEQARRASASTTARQLAVPNDRPAGYGLPPMDADEKSAETALLFGGSVLMTSSTPPVPVGWPDANRRGDVRLLVGAYGSDGVGCAASIPRGDRGPGQDGPGVDNPHPCHRHTTV
jgi:hypothetical protein